MKGDRSATLPLGSIGFEREPDAAGERLIWLSPHNTTGPGRQTSDPIDSLANYFTGNRRE
jgi:hypothetical protein